MNDFLNHHVQKKYPVITKLLAFVFALACLGPIWVSYFFASPSIFSNNVTITRSLNLQSNLFVRYGTFLSNDLTVLGNTTLCYKTDMYGQVTIYDAAYLNSILNVSNNGNPFWPTL